MNVTCDKCNKRYSIADDKVRGKSVKIRCKQCQNLISVQGPAADAGAAASPGGSSAAVGVALGSGSPAVAGSPWEEERTRAMPAMDTSAQWFAMVKGKQLGPFDLKGLEGKVKTGELTLRTYLWKQGMGDWKRASDVPEVSPVFAGVAVGATATGLTSALPAPERLSKKVPAVQRDVAMALETPSPEITARKTNGNGNGNGHGHAAEHAPDPVTQPVTRGKVPSVRVPAVARPAPLPAPLPDAAPTAPVPAPMPIAKPQAQQAPLSDLFGGDAENPPSDHGPIGDLAPDVAAAQAAVENDPFAALGPGDPSQVPAPGEATKFFIAQAGVNKRNPPWKIALFVLGGPGLIVGILFLLSTLKIVPLEVTRTNEAGEEVKESFFSPGGVSGIKDLFSGEAAKKKAEAERAKQAAAEKRRIAAAAAHNNDRPDRPDKPEKLDPKAEAEREAEKARLALVYGGNNTEVKPTRIPKDRNAGGTNTVVESSGLSQEASQKVVADKIKAFEGCIEQALRRNPNLAVGPIDVVLNVGASGAVTSASISPPKHNNTDWGQCMRDVGKRIVFPRSDGDSEVSLPLKVGVAVSP